MNDDYQYCISGQLVRVVKKDTVEHTSSPFTAVCNRIKKVTLRRGAGK